MQHLCGTPTLQPLAKLAHGAQRHRANHQRGSHKALPYETMKPSPLQEAEEDRKRAHRNAGVHLSDWRATVAPETEVRWACAVRTELGERTETPQFDTGGLAGSSRTAMPEALTGPCAAAAASVEQHVRGRRDELSLQRADLRLR
jgi:hypothetical protein